MTARDRLAFAPVALVAAPALIGGLYSLAAASGLAGAGAAGFNPGAITNGLLAAESWRAFAWTVASAGAATLLASAAAIFVAVRLRESAVGRWLAVAPLAVPHVAAVLAALLLLGQSGLLSRLAYAGGWIALPSDFPPLVYHASGAALIATMAWKEFPFLALMALAVLDTRGTLLEESARTLGATRWQSFRRVIWPALWRGIAPASIAAFAFLIGNYEIAALLGPSDPLPLPVLTLERWTDPDLGKRGEAHVLGVIALTACVILIGVHGRLRAGGAGEA